MNHSEALIQIANLHEILEAELRKASSSKSVTLNQLVTGPLKDKYTTSAQVRTMLTSLTKLGHVTTVKADKGPASYSWNLDSPPYLLGQKKQRAAAVKPSKVEVIKPESTNFKAVAKVLHEVEIQMGGFTFIIGVNPQTGRKRIIVEDI